ncbi:MAG: hypothetical protein PHD74_03725, partial [Candidatus Krumholzibacteria bacterium]|nr:hypothetical protein [Candidatus Krumholzibacteria bacterium]
ADDASALFVNPAGTMAASDPAAYLDYSEPPWSDVARESRLAVAGAARRMGFALGWYRFGSDAGSFDLLILNAARKLIDGTQGSFISLGANATVGRSTYEKTLVGDADSECKLSGDLGIIVRPLPVVSFGYAAGNVGGVRFVDAAGEESGRFVHRWGASYFWENRVILSFAAERIEGRTTLHYGLSAKTAAPIELLAGFADAHASGGVRWNGARCRAVIAFSAGDARHVEWTCGLEVGMRANADGEAP